MGTRTPSNPVTNTSSAPNRLLEDVRHYALEDLKARRQAETVTEAEAQHMVEAGTQTS